MEPFGSIIAAVRGGGSNACGGEKEGKVVLWVDEASVKGKVRSGMGVFGKVVRVEREREEGKGFWFVDMVEEVVGEVSRGEDGRESTRSTSEQKDEAEDGKWC